MWPVFVFGTGRCGSTHIQRLITLSTSCWIWGEHNGFLQPLLDSISLYENSQILDRTAFNVDPPSDDQLIGDMAAGSERLSWLNRFDKDEFRTEIAALVDRMFRPGVPNGWTHWGFKEIRYGLDNDAPATLLSLFPTATAVFTFREPRNTIESMIREWEGLELLDSPQSLHALSEAYRNHVYIWKKIMEYFLTYRSNGKARIFFVSSDKLSQPPEVILQTLELPVTRAIPRDLGITNLGPNRWPERTRIKFDELFAKDEGVCLDLFKRACIESDADFRASG
jgi:hypothetical protein